MFGNSSILNILNFPFEINLGPGFLLALFLIFTFFYIVGKLKAISDLRKKNDSLTNSLRKLDQQAKVILKNDMDIKLYQQKVEESKDKLELLRNFMYSTSHLLDAETLFSKINSGFFERLGFQKGLILRFDNFEEISSAGLQPPEIELIKYTLSQKKQTMKEKEILSSESETCKILSEKLNIKNTLITPIKNKNKIYALFFVAGLINTDSIKEYMKESILILCMHVAKCLNNIELFEQVYRTKEELESKIKSRTKELAASLQKVERISKTKSDFISSVSHELRTPLTSVKGFSSLLAADKFGNLPPEAKKRLIKVVENVDKLMDIVNILLDISRIESGKIKINIVPHDVPLLIKNVADFFEPQSKSKNIEITQNKPNALVAYMDKDLIERVLINLLNNAIKFTPEGGKIKINCQSKEEKVIISVADTGYGIPEENLDNIFQEFYRVKNIEERAIKGSGLGLSLVKRIIDSHKERIWVESEINKGTVFYFTLQKKKNE